MKGIGRTVGNSLSTVDVCLRCVVEVDGGRGGKRGRYSSSRESEVNDLGYLKF